jgi:hypothetical protein
VLRGLLTEYGEVMPQGRAGIKKDIPGALQHVAQFHLLSAASFALLAALAGDLTLGAALDAAQNDHAAFDLGSALRHFVALGVLTGATLQELSGNLSASTRPR